jgi:hypothetical protein
VERPEDAILESELPFQWNGSLERHPAKCWESVIF